MYKSPIELFQTDPVYETLIKDQEVRIMAKVNEYIQVDNYELLSALKYDREQYDKGYSDGHKDGYQRGIEDRPKGKWKGGTTDCFQCSNCSKISFYPSYVRVTEVEWDYCPYCGAYMRD